MSMALRDIALQLKVSPSTVSRALSGKGGVSEEVRQRIVRYAEECMFTVNPAAQALRTGQGAGVVLLAPLNRPEVARRRDEQLITRLRPLFGPAFSLTFDSGCDIEDYLKIAMAQQPRILIVSSVWTQKPEITEICGAHKVTALCIDSCIAGHDNIVLDRAEGTCQMARMFLLCGSTHPIYFSSEEELDSEGHGRLSGIRRAHQELGVELREDSIIPFRPGEDHSRTACELAGGLLRSRYIDAIFGFSDLGALGVSRAIAESGLARQRDIRLVGFDDLPFSSYLSTPLSTIAAPSDLVIEKAQELLLRRLEDPARPPETAVLPTRLVLRESSPVTDRELLREIF